MRIQDLRDVINRREYIETISCGEWTDGIEECCKNEIEILAQDIESTIAFLKSECTAKEFVWISEVIDEVVVKTRSRALLDCYTSLMAKFPEESKTYSISSSIEYAKNELKGVLEDEQSGTSDR